MTGETVAALIQLGAVFFGLGLLGRLAQRIGLSPIPLYLIGGLVFGHGGLVSLTGIDGFTHLGAEIGVILLLLMLGLEYSAAELFTSMRRGWPAGIVDIVLNFAPGAAGGFVLGLGWKGALVLGGVTYISSSGVIAKVLNDLGRTGNRETPVVLAVLVFEDLVMAAYLPILTAALSGAALVTGLTTVAVSLLVVTVVLFIGARFGRYVSAVLYSDNNEIFLLKLLGSALLVAGLAQKAGLSAAVGAFLLGIAIAGPAAHTAAKLLEPLRDLFAAAFFVLFGLSTDPSEIPPVLGWALALALVTTLTKLATGWWAARRQGIGPIGQARAAGSLVARGEFSIIIAGLAVSAGVGGNRLAALAATYVLIMAAFGPVTARYAEPLARRFKRMPPLARARASVGALTRLRRGQDAL